MDREDKSDIEAAVLCVNEIIDILNHIEPKLDRHDQMQVVTLRKELRTARGILDTLGKAHQ